jgi:hypothetical protein
MSRAIIAAVLAALWLIAFDTLPASVSKDPALSASAHAGTTVKSSKSTTSDRKRGSKKTGNPPAGIPGTRSY